MNDLNLSLKQGPQGAGMRAQAADGHDLRLAEILLAKDPHLAFAVGQSSTKRVGSLPGDDQDGVASVFDVVLEVVQDPTAFRHAGCRDNDHGLVPLVKRL